MIIARFVCYATDAPGTVHFMLASIGAVGVLLCEVPHSSLDFYPGCGSDGPSSTALCLVKDMGTCSGDTQAASVGSGSLAH